MNYTEWRDTYLQKVQIDDDIVFWRCGALRGPLVILVHGISGDHNGMLPLAQDLARDYHVVLVDLPGHGQATMPSRAKLVELQTWLSRSLPLIEERLGASATIIAHSFGCAVVVGTDTMFNHKTIFICPVPRPSVSYKFYAGLMWLSAPLISLIYNWGPFVTVRGIVLRRQPSKDSWARICWVGKNSQPTRPQFIYQARLIKKSLTAPLAPLAARRSVGHVIRATQDTTAHERTKEALANVFPNAVIAEVVGGHLVPIESPHLVADILRRFI